MHLVLTHEQADFDAVAACLAVHLLDESATPVLPRRLNRNVRAYLTLYGERLPFVAFEELGKRKIERITLVDTQSLPSVRGAHKKPQVHVVDHHPAGEQLSTDWTTHLEQVGATTTLLVEDLQRAGAALDQVHATLLLLGLYEDTGSLTYGGTTTRDLLAAAWLLEAGANLSLAVDFLNHPLSAEQRAVYERLLEAAESHSIQGLTVVIALAKADGMVDEVSTLAHKLRDVYDPAGLFVLVGLDADVQLVARSTSDSINVGRIAERFGGGGHSRAAAALIHDKAAEAVRDELLALLPEVVEPPMTVGELMSRDPQLLSPDTSIGRAAERMQRSGHEGYPVVDEKKVVGLLTRRAVDRAMAHRMGDRPVSSIMDAGELVVHPSDSVEHLQELMIRHDWGQVPVADPQGGQIIGIVTRTDLLRTLGNGRRTAAPANLADKLAAALPAARLALLREIAAQAEAQQVALYVVGGFVRDLLLGTPSVDFDLVTEGDAIQLAQSVAEKFGGNVSSHRRFGTAKWQLDADSPALAGVHHGGASQEDLPASLDFVSARSEFYLHPTALPTIERGSIKLDLHRRDFTINTLALRLDGQYYGRLLDHWGGGQDLAAGRIRVLHSLSFVDDPTRMLRAVRLEQRLEFTIEERTLELLLKARSLLDRVSGDRIRSEFNQIFREAEILAIMDRLSGLALLVAVHPGLTWDDWLRDQWRRALAFTPLPAWEIWDKPPVPFLLYALWVYRLEDSLAPEVLAVLNLPGTERQAIHEMRQVGRQLAALNKQAQPSEVVRVLEGRREMALAAAWLALNDDTTAQSYIDRFLGQWRHVRPNVDGDDLRQLGLPPGPAYGRILDRLRDAWLNGELSNPAEEEQMMAALVAAEESHG